MPCPLPNFPLSTLEAEGSHPWIHPLPGPYNKSLSWDLLSGVTLLPEEAEKKGREKGKKWKCGAEAPEFLSSAADTLPWSCTISAKEAPSQSCVAPGLPRLTTPFHLSRNTPEATLVKKPTSPLPRSHQLPITSSSARVAGLLELLLLFSDSVCKGRGTHMPQCARGSQRTTFRSLLPPWVLWIEHSGC